MKMKMDYKKYSEESAEDMFARLGALPRGKLTVLTVEHDVGCDCDLCKRGLVCEVGCKCAICTWIKDQA